MAKILWTQKEIEILEQGYKDGLPMQELVKKLNKAKGAISTKASKLGFTKKYIKKNNANYKAIYQDRNWLLSQIQLGKDADDIAKDLNVSRRVIEKWMFEKNRLVFREVYKLTPIQRQIVIWGTLGDGHIDARDTQPMYIESHSIAEKDYLFWKYEQLKPMYKKPPKFYKGQIKPFNGGDKIYRCQDFYRMSGKVIDDLIPIRNMSKLDKISTLDELGLSLYLLDDASRSDCNWDLCVAMLSDEEKELFIKLCQERFGIRCYVQNKDKRYIRFDAVSSRKIDDIMLSIFPHNLDIIQKKIYKHRRDLQ